MNEREFEDALGRWRAGEVPHSILVRSRPQQGFRKFVPVLGAVATLVGISCTAFIAMAPGRTLASGPVTVEQMAQAAKRIKYFSQTYSRIMGPEKGGGYRFCYQVTPNGGYVQVKHFSLESKRYDEYGYTEKNVEVSVEPAYGFATTMKSEWKYSAGPTTPSQISLEKWLLDNKLTVTTPHVIWKGIDCTRYRYEAQRGNVYVVQEVYVDSKTHLPVFHLNSRPREGWRDESEYSYEPFEVPDKYRTVPSGYRVYDIDSIQAQFRRANKANRGDIVCFVNPEFEDCAVVLRRRVESIGSKVLGKDFKGIRLEYGGKMKIDDTILFVYKRREVQMRVQQPYFPPQSVEKITGEFGVGSFDSQLKPQFFQLDLKDVPVINVHALGWFTDLYFSAP